MIYPVNVEPYGEDFIAVFPDVPSVTECIGVEPSDAILNAKERLDWALTEMFLAGKPQPRASAIVNGQVGIQSNLFWMVI